MKPDDASFFLRKRNYCASCVMISTMLAIWMKTNLSICMVNLTTNRTIISESNITYTEEPEFEWTSMEQGIILSSFFFGYLLSPIGGIIASHFGGVRTFTLGTMATAILYTVSPFLMKQNFYLYLVERFLEGVFEGISTASVGEILIHWAPQNERTFLTNLGTTGLPLGFVISYPVAGYLNKQFDWETTFYITGIISIVWSIIFFLTVADYPSQDKLMKKVERNYFKEVHKIALEEKIVHPWREIFKSKALWALLNEKFVEAWSTSFLAYCIPIYIRDVYQVNMEEMAWMSSVPHYFSILGKIPAAKLADYLSSNKICRKTKIHKTYIVSAQIAAIIFLILAGMTNHFVMSVIIFGLFQLCFSLAFVSSDVLPLDMGGRHSGVILGLCVTMNSIGFILNPLTIGILVTNHTFAEWSKYFIFMSALNGWTAIIFAVYGSGEVQPWAKVQRLPTIE